MLEVFNFLKNTKKFEMVYVSDNGEQYSFASEIKEVLDDRIKIIAPTCVDKDFGTLEDFARLNIVIYTENGVLTGNINILKKNHGEFNDAFISFPYNNQFCQRREDTRIPMHIDFELIFESGILSLKSKNISGKGISCITTESLPEFSDVEIIMHLPSGDVSTICRKVYSKEVDFNEKKVYVNGITFTDISEENIAAIVKDCLKFQLDSKRNERLFETL